MNLTIVTDTMDSVLPDVAVPWEAKWLAQHVWPVYQAVAGLPDTAPLGLLTTYAAAILMMPVILYVVLCIIWSIAGVGPARKSLTTFFILLLGVPLYPVLVGVLLAIIWFVLGVFGITLVTLGPLFLVAWGWWLLIEYKNEFVEKQQKKRRRSSHVQDITCTNLILGLFTGLICLSTVGACTAISTIAKSPILITSLFAQAWWHGIKGWLKLVECPCCYPRQPRSDSEESEDTHEEIEEYGGGGSGRGYLRSGSCCWWYWFPFVLAAWLIFIALGTCVAILVVIISAIVKLIASAIWPAYVTAGWLRFFDHMDTRRRDNSCRTALIQGFKAGYQVLWASDVLTNAFILGDPELIQKAYTQFLELAEGRREELDADCRKLSCLPPVVVGIFQNSWDLAARAIAKSLGVSKNEIEEAWRSLARQMIRVGRDAIEAEFLTKDWVEEVPAELCIGLPARVMLETIERSPNAGELVLSSGLILKRSPSWMGDEFFDKVWSNLMEAQNAYSQVRQSLSSDHRECLCAKLLAGGGDDKTLPSRLADMVEKYESIPEPTAQACRQIFRALIAVSVECSRRQAFKDKLLLVIEGITADDGSLYIEIADGKVESSDSEITLSSANDIEFL